MTSKATDRFRIYNLPLGIEEPESALLPRAAEIAGLAPESIGSLRIARKSVDARRQRGGRRRLRFVVHVDVVLPGGERTASFKAARRRGRPAPGPPRPGPNSR